MALFNWLRGLFAPKRDVSRLDGDPDRDAVYEVVDTSGGPLKENHRRKALRDKRLLPKRWKFGRRKKIFEQLEAQRLFSLTQRTSQREIRDLRADEEQLGRYRLPIWRHEADVARALGLSLKELYHYSVHRYRDPVEHYVTFSIPKRSGGERLIMAPKKRLKGLQRKLLAELVGKLPISPYAHAFTPGRSIRSGAERHVGKKILLKMDLRDFFPSVTFPRIRGLLIALGYSYPVSTTLAVLMTAAERQPVEVGDQLYYVPVGPRHCVQGAPTSPGLCNCIALRLDRRLAGLGKKFGFEYTRYADDLTFSGDQVDKVWTLRYLVEQIVADEGFEVNRAKTRISRAGGRQAVTGVVVNQQVGGKREFRRRLRAELHQLSLEKTPDPDRMQRALGRLAFLQMLNPEQAEKLRRKYLN